MIPHWKTKNCNIHLEHFSLCNTAKLSIPIALLFPVMDLTANMEIHYEMNQLVHQLGHNVDSGGNHGTIHNGSTEFSSA
jgi:hypothetical protein